MNWFWTVAPLTQRRKMEQRRCNKTIDKKLRTFRFSQDFYQSQLIPLTEAFEI